MFSLYQWCVQGKQQFRFPEPYFRPTVNNEPHFLVVIYLLPVRIWSSSNTVQTPLQDEQKHYDLIIRADKH